MTTSVQTLLEQLIPQLTALYTSLTGNTAVPSVPEVPSPALPPVVTPAPGLPGGLSIPGLTGGTTASSNPLGSLLGGLTGGGSVPSIPSLPGLSSLVGGGSKGEEEHGDVPGVDKLPDEIVPVPFGISGDQL